MFDTFEYAKKLREAGVNEKQVEAQVSGLRDLVYERLVTKEDLANVKTALKLDIDRVETALKSDIDRVETTLKADIRELETNINSKFEHVDARFERIDSKFANLEQKIETSMYRAVFIIIGSIATGIAILKYF